MLKVLSCIAYDHDVRFVVLAAIVCLLSSVTAFWLYGRVVSPRAPRTLWLVLTSVVVGAGTWATHFIAMLAYQPGFSTGYESVGTGVSLLLAILDAAAGFAVASTIGFGRIARVLAGGVILGGGLSAMHFIGMGAFRTQGHLSWNAGYVAIAVIMAVVFSSAALFFAGRARRIPQRLSAAGLLTLAICGLHFTGMAAVTITPDPTVAVPASVLPVEVMAPLVAFLALLLIGGAVCTVMVEFFSRRAAVTSVRAAVDAMSEGLALFDRNGRCVLWNDRYVELAPPGAPIKEGFRLVDLLKSGLAQGWFLDAIGREEAWLAEGMATSTAGGASMELHLVGDRWMRVEVRRTADAGSAVSCVDVTDLKRREASFRLMYEHNPVAMWLVDESTLEILDVNPATEALLGRSAGDFKGLTILDIVDPSEHEELTRVADQSRVGRYEGDRSWRVLRPDGSARHVRPYSKVLPMESGPVVLAALVHVTAQVAVAAEQARIAEVLEQARAEAEAANRAKSEFLANMSHEIRTPLNGVVAVADMLSKADLRTEEREMVEIVRTSGATLERLLSDVLDLAKVESGQLKLEAAPFHLGEMIRGVAVLNGLHAAEKGVALKVAISPELDSAMLGDQLRIRQILTNLVSNAVKFTERGEVRIAVSRNPDGLARFAVEDTGVGFDLAEKERVFGRFQQADGSITRRFGGTGLGVAISRNLAELMGGVLDCHSAPGEGSCFWIDIPLPPAQVSAAPARAPPPVAALPEAILRILLADDHPTNRKVVELMLADTGAELVSVENGDEAVQLYAEKGFDLVLMDMQMPVMDGLSAVREIRRIEQSRNARRTPIIMLTANALREHVEAAKAAGADRHLSKPITTEALYGAIEAVLFAADARDGLAA